MPMAIRMVLRSLVVFMTMQLAIGENGMCGRQASGYSPKVSSGRQRVINGQEAIPHSWPWAVIQNINGNVFCGATLIRVSEKLEESDIILTAAHCVRTTKPENSPDYNGWTITAGTQHRTKSSPGQVTRNVILAKNHPDYKPVVHDIALLLLDKPIKFSDTIRPPCLPKKDQDAPTDRVCVVGGWGRNQSDNQQLPADTLQQSVQPVQNPSACQKPWGGSFVEKSMLCVGVLDGSSGVCNGDSGGMLVCKGKDEAWMQHGVLSFVGGSGKCIAPGWPSVFTKVSHYIDWVKKEIQNMSKLVNK